MILNDWIVCLRWLVKCLLLCMLVWWLNAFLSFCDARFERHRRGRGLPQECIRRKWNTLSTSFNEGAQGHSYSRQAIYLLHTWIQIIHFALFYYCFLIMHGFYIAIILYIAIVDDLAPQVDLISSIEMTPLVTYSTPLFTRDLMVSINALGKNL
jgi:hypothetical protein